MKRLSFVSSVLFLAAAGAAGAQTDRAPIYGTVYRYAPGEPDPAPLPSVTVTLHPAFDSSRAPSSLTDNHGRYAFYDVSPGTYDLFFYINFNPSEDEAGQRANFRQRITTHTSEATNVRPVVLNAN